MGICVATGWTGTGWTGLVGTLLLTYGAHHLTGSQGRVSIYLNSIPLPYSYFFSLLSFEKAYTDNGRF